MLIYNQRINAFCLNNYLLVSEICPDTYFLYKKKYTMEVIWVSVFFEGVYFFKKLNSNQSVMYIFK